MAQILVLERYCYSERMGTFGRVLDLPFDCYTVEQPWRGNRPFESCVPEGVYRLVPVTSPRWGRTYALVNEQNRVFAAHSDIERDGDRWACLLHAANKAVELAGCIAPGQREWGMDDAWAVTRSGVTLAKLLEHIQQHNIRELHIIGYRPQWP